MVSGKKVQQTRLSKNKVTKRLRVKGGNVLIERGQISGVHSQQTEEVHGGAWVAHRHTKAWTLIFMCSGNIEKIKKSVAIMQTSIVNNISSTKCTGVNNAVYCSA